MIRKILHKPQALLGLAMMLIVFFVVAFAPFIAPHDPSELNVAHALSAPDSEYPLGTDEGALRIFTIALWRAVIYVYRSALAYHFGTCQYGRSYCLRLSGRCT